MRRLFLFCAAFLSIACGRESAARNDSTNTHSPSPASAPAAAPPAPAVLPSTSEAATDPRAAFARYLPYATFRGAPPGGAGLGPCPAFAADEGGSDEGWEPDQYVGFVRPRILGVTMSEGDTTLGSATGRAELVRVAGITRDTVGWVGTLEHRVDTLDFMLQRGPAGWTVCGPATRPSAGSPAYELEFVITFESAQRTQVNEARWLPAGTSWPDVAAHTDSVLTAGAASHSP